ncbi:MAG: sterol desaturase family protein [Rhodospirillales bacterium]|nr:sterol desaturase family protein [Rhodospirillales bacterium]
MEQFKYLLSWVLWPGLFGLCMVIAGYGFSHDAPVLYFNMAYVFLILSLFFLEKWMPYEREWLKPDGQNTASILHTISSKGSVQLLFLFSGVIGLADYITPMDQEGYSVWPRDWPLWAQVILGMVAAEFGLYWAHRLAHEIPWMWRFHAVHHSVTKLWFLNTGRFHFVDSLISIVLGLAILLSLGAPMEVVKWLSAITAFIGMLTHCNVEMRFGLLNWIFNTPGLHRWHHSRQLYEGNRNYGENLMVWDQIFGTFYNHSYRPSADIGMGDYMPVKFTYQILWPFLTNKMKQRLQPDFEPVPFGREGDADHPVPDFAKRKSLFAVIASLFASRKPRVQI